MVQLMAIEPHKRCSLKRLASVVTDKAEAAGPRVVVRFLEARGLLAADVFTGKSDPICFAFMGQREDGSLLEMFDDAVLADQVKMTKVVPETVDPVWNEEAVFAIRSDATVQDLEETWITIVVRDEDIEEDEISYDELGMVRIWLKDIAKTGKHMQHMCVSAPAWYSLQKWGGMSKVAGRVKLAVTLAYGNEDYQTVVQTFAETRQAKGQSSPNALARESSSRSPARLRSSMTDILKRVASSRRELSPYRPQRPRTPERRASNPPEDNDTEIPELSKSLEPSTIEAPRASSVRSDSGSVNASQASRAADHEGADEEEEADYEEEHPELEPPPPSFEASLRRDEADKLQRGSELPNGIRDLATDSEGPTSAPVYEQQLQQRGRAGEEAKAAPRRSAADGRQAASQLPTLPFQPTKPRLATIANMVRTAQALKKSRGDVDKMWVADLLAAFDKLADRSTEKVGMGVALHLVQNPRPTGFEFGEAHMLQLLGAARKTVDSGSVSLRKNVMDLLRICMALHAGTCAGKTSLAALLVFLLKCIHNDSGASTLKGPLSELAATIPLTVSEATAEFYERAASQLQSCLSEQSVTVQELACACLAAVYHFPEPTMLLQVAPHQVGNRGADAAQIRKLVGPSRSPVKARRADSRQQQPPVEVIDPVSGKSTAVLVEVSLQEWPEIQLRLESPGNKARFRFDVVTAAWQAQFMSDARTQHVHFLVNSGLRTLTECIAQHATRSPPASVGLLAALQGVCENCIHQGGGDGEPDEVAGKLAQALAMHLSALLPILLRILTQSERTFWKARSSAALVIAAMCGVEACQPAMRQAQIRLQADLKGLTSDPIAEVRQNAKHALHALSAIEEPHDEQDDLGDVQPVFEALPGDQAVPEATSNNDAVVALESAPHGTQVDIESASKMPREASTASVPRRSLSPEDVSRSVKHAGGNSTHTARMLKKLNTQTTTLQAMVDDLTIQTRQSLEMLKQLTPKHSSQTHRDRSDASVASTVTEDAYHDGQRYATPPRRQLSPRRLAQPQQPLVREQRLQRSQELWQHVTQLMDNGDTSRAFQEVLATGRDKNIVQLMQNTGPCPERLDNATRERLLLYVAGLISRGTSLVLALPWVYHTVSKNCVQHLSPDTRETVANSLHDLSAVPTEHGVIAARLHRYYAVSR